MICACVRNRSVDYYDREKKNLQTHRTAKLSTLYVIRKQVQQQIGACYSLISYRYNNSTQDVTATDTTVMQKDWK